MPALMEGLRASLRVVIARSTDERSGVQPVGTLLGLARVVGDGATICYLQDVLVNPAAQRRDIGGALVREAFSPCAHVRQHVLITDEEPGQKAFYESLGFAQLGDAMPGRAFVRFASA